MPQIVYEILSLLGALIRMLGLLMFGLGIGWFALEGFRKSQQNWQLQIAVFLGLVALSGIMIYTLYYNAPSALGLYGIGFGVAMFLWGIPKKKDDKQN